MSGRALPRSHCHTAASAQCGGIGARCLTDVSKLAVAGLTERVARTASAAAASIAVAKSAAVATAGSPVRAEATVTASAATVVTATVAATAAAAERSKKGTRRETSRV